MARHMSNLHNSRPGGGGGYSVCILVGVLGAGTAQKGGSRCAYSLKKKGGGLRCGHSQKKGGLRPRGLRYVYNPKRVTFFL